jgi:hypothetical protein
LTNFSLIPDIGSGIEIVLRSAELMLQEIAGRQGSGQVFSGGGSRNHLLQILIAKVVDPLTLVMVIVANDDCVTANETQFAKIQIQSGICWNLAWNLVQNRLDGPNMRHAFWFQDATMFASAANWG